MHDLCMLKIYICLASASSSVVTIGVNCCASDASNRYCASCPMICTLTDLGCSAFGSQTGLGGGNWGIDAFGLDSTGGGGGHDRKAGGGAKFFAKAMLAGNGGPPELLDAMALWLLVGGQNSISNFRLCVTRIRRKFEDMSTYDQEDTQKRLTAWHIKTHACFLHMHRWKCNWKARVPRSKTEPQHVKWKDLNMYSSGFSA